MSEEKMAAIFGCKAILNIILEHTEIIDGWG